MTYVDTDSYVYLDEVDEHLQFFIKICDVDLETLKKIYPEPARNSREDSLAEHLWKKMKSTYYDSPLVLFLWGLDPGNRDRMARYFGVYNTEEVMKFGYFFEKVRQNAPYFLEKLRKEFKKVTAPKIEELLEVPVPKTVAEIIVGFLDGKIPQDKNPARTYASLNTPQKEEFIELVNPLNT